jgi:class 3 adenylate cyclase/tetratricopeptide (TPR) repeat protein
MSSQRTTYVCSRCGHSSGEHDHFCSQCGSKLPQGGRDARPLLRRERKIATVMFADVKGSTEVVSQEDPERASEWLGHAVNLMSDAVHRFGGTVNRVQGDGIMALFGAPIEFEDHAVRACGAALAILDAASGDLPQPGPKYRIRIGVSSGEIMTLPVASDAAVNYDAMGAVVHLAARLEQAAEPGSALVSLATWQGTNNVFEARRRDLTDLRGLPASVPAFELLGWSAKRDIGRGIRPDSIFINREEAIATLSQALSSLARKQGRVVYLSGEAGLGKSRLISEFFSRLPDGVRIGTSQSSPYRRFAYGPLADLVADLAGIDADMTPEMRKLRLSALVGNEHSPLSQDSDELATLLDITSSRSELVSLAPMDRRLRVEAAASSLFASLSHEKPLILLVEDLHWLDEDDLNQLTRLCETLRSARCLMLLTARNEWDRASALVSQSDYQCHLTPLAPAEAGQLLDGLIRPGRGTAALSREIVERTAGNPLFIEETLNALYQAGALVREDRVYNLQRPGVEIPLSPTVRGLLATRIDRLDDTLKNVLQAIAVIGLNATPGLLQSLLNLDATVIDQAIERLVTLDLLTVDPVVRRFADIQLQFRHPLAREVAYEQTLLRDRARIHRWMLARLEEEQRSGLHDRTATLAEHAFRAEAWEKAAGYMLKAGHEAFWRDAKTESVRFLMRGLKAVEKSDSPANALIGLQLRLELRNPLFQLARMDELATHLTAARAVAVNLSDPVHVGRYHIFQSHYYWFTGDSKGALREAQEAEALAAASGLRALGLRAQFQRGLVHFTCGEHLQAIADIDAVGKAIISEKPQDQFGMNKSLLVTTLGYSARAHAELGQIGKAREDAARSLAIARELNNQFEWVFAYVAEGLVNLRADDPERALPFLERAHDLCQTADVPLMGPVATSFLSLGLLISTSRANAPNPSDYRRALALAEQSVKQGNEFRFRAFQPMRLAILSRALLANGRSEDALASASSAIELARLQAEPPSEMEGLIALSQARRALGLDWRAALGDAALIARQLQMLPAVAVCERLELA